MKTRQITFGLGFTTLALALVFTIAAENPDYTQTYGDVTFFFNRNEEKIKVTGINKEGTEVYFGGSTIIDINTAKEIQELLILDFLNAQIDVESTITESEQNQKTTKTKPKVTKLGNSTRGEKKELTKEDKVIAVFHQKAFERFKDNKSIVTVEGNFSMLPDGKEKNNKPNGDTRVIGETLFDQSCGDPTEASGSKKPDFNGDVCAEHAWNIHKLQFQLIHQVLKPLGVVNKKEQKNAISKTQRMIRAEMRKLKKLGVQCCQINNLPDIEEIKARGENVKKEMESLKFAKEGTVVSKPFEYYLRLQAPDGYLWNFLGTEDLYDTYVLEKAPPPIPTPELSGDSQVLE